MVCSLISHWEGTRWGLTVQAPLFSLRAQGLDTSGKGCSQVPLLPGTQGVTWSKPGPRDLKCCTALLYDDSGTLHQHRQKGQRTGLLFSIWVYFPIKTREGLSFRAQKGLLGSWTRALWRLGRGPLCADSDAGDFLPVLFVTEEPQLPVSHLHGML